MLKIAWRNLWRNKTRTFIAISAVAVTYALTIANMGVAESMYQKMQKGAALSAGGSVLIHGKGYWDVQLNDVVLKNPIPIVDKLKERKDVSAIASRVIINGLISSSTSSLGVRLSGINVDDEKAFQDFSPHAVHKKFIGCEDKPIALGQKLVSDLGLEMGDKVVITATAPDGEVTRALFYLCDALKTGSRELDKMIAFAPINDLQKAFNFGDAVTQIGILSTEREALSADLKTTLKRDTDPLEVLIWEEAMPDLVGMIKMDAAFGDLFNLILFIVVLFAIMNTFLMIVMERVREFGLLSAIGLTPLQVSKTIFLETLVITLLSIVIGFTIGFSIHFYIASVGIDIASLYGDSIEMGGVSMTDTVMRSVVAPKRWLSATIAVFFLTMASAIYPAWKAGRLAPAESMRFFG